MVYTALVFFTVGAIVAAVADGFGPLLVGRSLQGIGGGGLIALTEILVTDLVPLRLRGQWFGIISAMWSIGSVTGPIVGGAFAQEVSWVSTMQLWPCSKNLFLTLYAALDLLYQPSFHRHCFSLCLFLPQAPLHAHKTIRPTPPCRLDWLNNLHRVHNQSPDSDHLGRRILPLDIMADPRPSHYWHSRPSGIRCL